MNLLDKYSEASTNTPSPLDKYTSAAPQASAAPASLSDHIWNGLAGAGQQIAGAFQGGLNTAQEGYQQAKETTTIPGKLAAGMHMLAGGVQSLFSPLAPVTAPIGAGVNAAADKISDIPAVQSFATSGAGKTAIQGAQFVNDTATVLPAAAGALSPKAVVSGVSDTASSVKGGISDTLQSVKNSLVGTPEEQARATANSKFAVSEALKKKGVIDATPSYNPKLVGEQPVEGIPRVQGGNGLLDSRTVTPRASEIAAGEELSKIEGYDPKATSLDKYNLVKATIATKAQELSSSLKSENILRPPQEIIKVVSDAVNQVPHESLLIQKSDPIIGNYMRVVKNAVTQNDGTLAGELEVRKALDAAYANARGKLAFGSDKISALDDLHTAARNAINDDMIAHARSTDIKASLQSQSNLYRAADVLQKKAEQEGNSRLDQIMKANPRTTKVVTTGLKSVGLGAGLHLIP